MTTVPRPPEGRDHNPGWPSNIQSEEEARDVANATAWTIGCLGALGGPPGWIAAGVSIVGAYWYDYYVRKQEGLY